MMGATYPTKKALKAVQQLRAQGFDRSIPFEHAWKVRCSQCQAYVHAINGYAMHETGCPNAVTVLRGQ